MKKEKGITLIALVITIIVLLILAGVSIATLTGQNGLLTKASTAKEKHKITQYREELSLIITGEITERKTEAKSEPMIESLENKINPKDWVNKTSRENAEGTLEEYLIVESKEGYEFIIEVNNEKETAKIIQENKTPGEKYTITYDSNGGVGQPKTVEVRSGFYKILEKNTYTREDYVFVGWCEKQEPDEEAKPYLEESKYQAKKNVTLYAVWSYNVATITFNANTGTGSIESKKVTKGQDTTLSSNRFTKENYDFIKWNTKADGTGKDYEDSSSINITDDVTLYAIWKIKAEYALRTNLSASTTAGKSPYVLYNGRICRVLYNDSTHGIQIITSESVGNVTLGYGDTEVKATNFTYDGTATVDENFKKAATSYNNVVDNLNKRAKTYMDTKGIARDARCLGSISTLNSSLKFQGDATSTMWSGSYDFLTTYKWNNKFKNADTNYTEDVKQLNDLGLNASSGRTWLASRRIASGVASSSFSAWELNPEGGLCSATPGCYVHYSGVGYGCSPVTGFRPVFLLRANFTIISGDGSSANPYVIE